MTRKASKKRRQARQKRLRKRLVALLGQRVTNEVLACRVPIMAAVGDLAEPDRNRAIQLAEQLRGELNR